MSRVAVMVIGILATVTGTAAGQNAPTAPVPKGEYQLKDVPPLPMPGPGGFRSTLPTADFRGLSRYSFKIDPETPVEELLPIRPQVKASRGPLISDDLLT